MLVKIGWTQVALRRTADDDNDDVSNNDDDDDDDDGDDSVLAFLFLSCSLSLFEMSSGGDGGDCEYNPRRLPWQRIDVLIVSSLETVDTGPHQYRKTKRTHTQGD